ncbi:winged helix-turn-helix domain-containing protein [Marinicella meishanensis]|uniref:winged helix-turn-helix domain-containing protein n=1 Tax=Marinicella meishanensis TaxID=2873263 RepID=UPI001CBFE0FD|nr:winged helix-turn-helix domain-containing protein [Marinicella sp. NBU2979]
MQTDQTTQYLTAQLAICAASGEVKGLDHQTIRLGPVPLRVLVVLLNHAGAICSRQQLFDAVWPNQVISEDALTKCISDLRNQLKPLTTEHPLINTIPKKGYRWLPSVRVGAADVAQPPNSPSPWLHRFKLMAMGLVAFWLLTWGLLAALSTFTQPTTTPLVILPTQITNPTQRSHDPLALDLASHLKQAAMQHDDLRYLSGHAIESHQGSPFPHFRHEFGVQWFIESEVVLTESAVEVTLNLVDAKTALVIHSAQHSGPNPLSLAAWCADFMHFVAEL